MSRCGVRFLSTVKYYESNILIKVSDIQLPFKVNKLSLLLSSNSHSKLIELTEP